MEWIGGRNRGDKAPRAMRASRLDPRVGLAFDHAMRYRPPVGRNVSSRFGRVNTFREIFFICPIRDHTRRRQAERLAPSRLRRAKLLHARPHFKNNLFSSRLFFASRAQRRSERIDVFAGRGGERRQRRVNRTRKFFPPRHRFRHPGTRFARKCANPERHDRSFRRCERDLPPMKKPGR